MIRNIKKPNFLSNIKISKNLLSDIRNLIETTRYRVAQAVNSGLVLLYWNIGFRIRKEILSEKRAAYGEQILQTLSAKLTHDYGNGFSWRNLSSMIRFVDVFPVPKIVETLSAQLGWSHFLEIIYLKDSLQRDFYAEMCRIERWSVRTLRQKINSMLYERTALSKKPAHLAVLELKKLRQEDKITPDLVFRDPYFLDFLGLKGAYQEKDMEAAILRELETFILELGSDFTFVARQKRLHIGNKNYYLDLLFYHRKLKRLVAVELKLGHFKAEYKGQMELYLRWLEKHEQRRGENDPIGLILCAGKDHEEIELLKLNKSGIRVAEYMTELPPRKMLENKLHKAIRIARERLLTQDKLDIR
jgi:predicted nuclease of restriction endonuclease-like (RecB) superfamily